MVQVLGVFLMVIGYLELVNCAYSDTSETREILHLNGIWNCYCEWDGKSLNYGERRGLRKLNGIMKMPVPGSVGDFDMRSCSGSVWYERSFFIPKSWKYERAVYVRVDGLSADTTVWLNGETIETDQKDIVELEVTNKLIHDAENRMALQVKKSSQYAETFPRLPRSISLLSVPEILYLQGISVSCTVGNKTAFIKYKAKANGLLKHNSKCLSVQVLDNDDQEIAFNVANDSLEGHFCIPNVNYWWPSCMDSRAGYRYTLVFKLYYKYCESDVKDVFRMKLGIRILNWSNSSLMVNDKSFYLQGVHGSDYWARKPFMPDVNLKDITLLKWLHANALVTSVAPSQETLDMADELGLFVIVGSPMNVLEDVIIRYSHHPSVIMWSIADIGSCNSDECMRFNDSFIERVKSLDSTRPLTAMIPLSQVENANMISKLDFVSLELGNAFLENKLLLQDTLCQLKKPLILMYGDQFLTTKSRIRALNFNINPDTNRWLGEVKRNISLCGEFYGNFIAYESVKGETLTLVDGIFNRNREPTFAADCVRSKFEPKITSCPCRGSGCKFGRKMRTELP